MWTRLRCHQLSLSARLVLVTNKHTLPCSAVLGCLDLSGCAESDATHTLYNAHRLGWCLGPAVCVSDWCLKRFFEPLLETSTLLLTSNSPFLFFFLLFSLQPPPHTLTHRGQDEIIKLLYWSTGLIHCTGLLPLQTVWECLHSDTTSILCVGLPDVRWKWNLQIRKRASAWWHFSGSKRYFCVQLKKDESLVPHKQSMCLCVFWCVLLSMT